MTANDPQLLVSTDWLAGHLNAPDVRILDASWHMPGSGRDARAEFERGHIPGARFFDIDEISDEQSSLPHMAPPVEKFVSRFKPGRERCWIAELDGERVGAVFVVEQSKSVAQLRLLILEPRARGRGLGKRLVRECIDFARASGYRKLVLWTQSNLAAARAIYRGCGFTLARREPHAEFGVRLHPEPVFVGVEL